LFVDNDEFRTKSIGQIFNVGSKPREPAVRSSFRSRTLGSFGIFGTVRNQIRKHSPSPLRIVRDIETPRHSVVDGVRCHGRFIIVSL